MSDDLENTSTEPSRATIVMPPEQALTTAVEGPTYNLEEGWFKQTQKCSYDGYLLQVMAKLKKAVLTDGWDCIILVDGISGVGKSVFALQLAMLFNTIVYICYTVDKLVDRIKKSTIGNVILFDEGLEGLYSREAMTSVTRNLVKLIQMIRQKNLIIIICCPSFYDLDRNIALWRSRCLIHILVGKDFSRGTFSFYNSPKKKQLFLLGKKLYDYTCVRSLFHGRFSGKYVIDKNAYLEMKAKALQDFEVNEAKNQSFTDKRFQALLCWVKKNYELTDEELAEGMCGEGVLMTPDGIRKVRERFNKTKKNVVGGVVNGEANGDGKEGESVSEVRAGTTDA